MGSTSSQSRELAKRLIARELARGKSAKSEATATATQSVSPPARVCEKLQGVLTAFAGVTGFRTLLARALVLAAQEEPSLKGVRVLETGALSGLEGVQARGAGVALVAQLLDLLIVFIGEPLTLQMVRGAWPEVPAGEIRFGKKDIP